ncbi:MAG: winged helix-turn-helix transcriptional regulator [Candidatus Protochlamydia sp.]|nr:winged helix-turn-helix transcriptional regulator [Candidatus Protochlamydia sp.]
MLQVLCGNKNVERVLLFLFVNGKCYGTQLHRSLKAPLTPIQKALNRLEKGGLISSYYEGKTRLYQFNHACPLLEELQQLLKKAYTLLPSNEKKNYYVMKENLSMLSTDEESKIYILLSFWKKLSAVTQLTFHAKSHSKEEGGWAGNGKGEVCCISENNVLVFNEKGTWQDREGGKVNFNNTYRWSLDRNAKVISLEHLRRGPDHPVFLFHLSPTSKHSLSSIDSHLCGGDAYFGQLHLTSHSLKLSWRAIGPKKNEEMDYYYS